MKHVYDWLDEPSTDENEKLAKEWLGNFCLPAFEKNYEWLSARVLSCEYRGKRWRCIGASRLGDVWLTKDCSRENGYDVRVDVTDCSNWQTKIAAKEFYENTN